MPEDNTRNGLRVGGWIPPYSPGGGPAGPIRPTASPHNDTFNTREPFARLRGESTARPRLMLAAALCLACAATAAIAVLMDATRSPQPVAAEFTFPAPGEPLPAFPPAPSSGGVPVSMQPSPTDTILPVGGKQPAVAPPATSPVATRKTTNPSRATSPTTSSATHPATRPATRPATPAPVRLNAGSTVGLEAADRPGYRVRHQYFRGRLDAISASSSPWERADSGFRVRAGLGDDDCVSLESVNFPGYFLRHRNFEIRLDRNDGSALFRQDATFCPTTIRDGAALALRSANYPRHHVVTDGDRLKIAETTAASATAFTPRDAL